MKNGSNIEMSGGEGQGGGGRRGCDYKEIARESFLGVMELFFILILMMVTQIHAYVKIHITVKVCKLYITLKP